jgi:hypothetical protein
MWAGYALCIAFICIYFMKLVLTGTVEKQIASFGWGIGDLVKFLKKHRDFSGFVKLCAPLKDIIVYKAYLDSRKRMILFVMSGRLVYPVYAGDKNGGLAKNITVQKVRLMAEEWQDLVIRDIDNRNYKIRHY